MSIPLFKKYKNKNMISNIFDYIEINKIFLITQGNKFLTSLVKEKFNLPLLYEFYKDNILKKEIFIQMIDFISRDIINVESQIYYLFCLYIKLMKKNKKKILIKFNEKIKNKYIIMFMNLIKYYNIKEIEFEDFPQNFLFTNNQFSKIDIEDIKVNNGKNFDIFQDKFLNEKKIKNAVFYLNNFNVNKFNKIEKLDFILNDKSSNFLLKDINLLSNLKELNLIEDCNFNKIKKILYKIKNIPNLIIKYYHSLSNYKSMFDFLFKNFYLKNFKEFHIILNKSDISKENKENINIIIDKLNNIMSINKNTNLSIDIVSGFENTTLIKIENENFYYYNDNFNNFIFNDNSLNPLFKNNYIINCFDSTYPNVYSLLKKFYIDSILNIDILTILNCSFLNRKQKYFEYIKCNIKEKLVFENVIFKIDNTIDKLIVEIMGCFNKIQKIEFNNCIFKEEKKEYKFSYNDFFKSNLNNLIFNNCKVNKLNNKEIQTIKIDYNNLTPYLTRIEKFIMLEVN